MITYTNTVESIYYIHTWGGATAVKNRIIDLNLTDIADQILSDFCGDSYPPMSATDLNDLIWFDLESMILQWLGVEDDNVSLFDDKIEELIAQLVA